MNDLPDPERQAQRFRENHEGGGFGPAHDAIVEARIEADWMHTRCRRMAVDLDGMLDDLGLFPAVIRAMVYDAKQRVQETAEWAERFANALESQQEVLVEEHEEDADA